MSELPSSAHRIGIFGGTFDPVHFGHLRPALELGESLGVDAVRLLPCHLPAHRESPGATTEQRIAMLNLAIEGASRLQVDERETQREAFSYSVDTLKLFRAEFPDSQLLFFMGMDAFAKLTQWHKWEQMLELSHLIVIDRPGAILSGEEERLFVSRQASDVDQLTSMAGRIVLQSVTQSDISATRIRTLQAAGRDIRYLLPESVRRYILANDLYC